ncbi:MAG: hypothetical protein QME45_04215 [Clostridiales bacterium]|jgi:regulator of replication initiation timing|nr:hypothetical protein [Clostridiales bacterium]
MRNILERIFDWLDRQLHAETYDALDNENVNLRIKNAELEDRLESYEEIEEARNAEKRAHQVIWW